MRRLQILVVEDNLDTQYLVCEILKNFGHQTQAASDGEEACRILTTARFDVLFTDVSLPGISGIDLARAALLAQPGLHIILASGFGTALTSHVEFPCTCLEKPYDIEQLQKALESSIGDSHSGLPI